MDKKHIHFMGAGGSGCSAAIALADHFGYQVSGCDMEADSPYLEKTLSKKVRVGHAPDHLNGVDKLVYSPAIPSLDPDNQELKVAEENGIEAVPWEKFVASDLLKNKFVIAITGTHGKGTVTAMVAVILEKAGFDPTCLVGGVVNSWKKNYRVGQSKHFVIEVDEYKERFLNYSPDVAAITNIEFDHPEYFEDFSAVKKAFEKFVGGMRNNSVLVVGPKVDIKNPNGTTVKTKINHHLNLKMIGEFNKFNASVATSIAQSLRIPDKIIKEALEGFSGMERRFEFKGEEKEVLVFNDYAHHPTAVLATLNAAREKFGEKRIWVVFQPHLFTRIRVLFDDFVKVFENVPVDRIIIVDIFGAREKKSSGISSVDLVRAIKNTQAKYIPTLEETAVYLTKNVSAGDIVIAIGAGDIYKLPNMLLNKLENKA